MIARAVRTEYYQEKLRVRLDSLPFPIALLTILGFTLGIEVQFTGTLFLGEILLAMFAVLGTCLNLGNSKFWTKDLYRFMICLAITYLGYMLTDISVGTSADNLLRGWARIGFLATDTLGLYVICRKNRYNLFPLFLGLAFSAFLMPHTTLQGDFAVKWKFDLYFSWVSSICILAGFFGRRKAPIYAYMSLIPVSVMSMVLDSRLVGGACMAVVGALMAQSLTGRRLKNLLLVVLVLAISAGSAGTYYMLNQTGQEYAERRTESNVARMTAILTAIQHIGQHPVLGTGSWNVSEEHMNRHRANTTNLGGKYVSAGMALGHSQILQAAVEGGIFGGHVLRLFPGLSGAGPVVGLEATARPVFGVCHVQSSDVPLALSVQSSRLLTAH